MTREEIVTLLIGFTKDCRRRGIVLGDDVAWDFIDRVTQEKPPAPFGEGANVPGDTYPDGKL